MAKSRNNKKRLERLRVAVEISHSHLQLMVRERSDNENEQPTVRFERIRWRENPSPLHSEENIEQLTGGLRRLVEAHQLAGARVGIAVNSDFCVTRVTAGETEDVRREVQELADRSALYLSLGTGENRVAECAVPLDARSQQAWVSVTNQRTLDAIVQAVSKAGICAEWVEHSLVAASRAVGRMELDSDAPVLIVELNQRGVEVGISYRGQLLLDYRPGGGVAADQIASVVQKHLKRLQRYCQRRFTFVDQEISRVLLCGLPESIDRVRQDFQQKTSLEALVLEPSDVFPGEKLQNPPPIGPDFTTTTGTLLLVEQSLFDRHAPNLIDELTSRLRDPLGPALLKAAWPVAAALLLTAGIYAAAVYQSSRAGRLERRLADLGQARQKVEVLKTRVTQARAKVENLKAIQQQLSPPFWHLLLGEISGCKPASTWLDRIVVNSDGTVRLVGPSHSEDEIYEFVKELREVERLETVALEGTQPITVDGIPATRFDITCKLAQSTQTLNPGE